MKKVLWLLLFVVAAASGAQAVEFLGVELCAGSVDTSVVLPVGSELALQSAEIGRHGGLLLLLTATTGDVMDHIDDLMTEATGVRGSGDATKLQWSGNSITAYAQVIKEGYAALAVSTTDLCSTAEPMSTPGGAASESAATTAQAPATGSAGEAQPETANPAAAEVAPAVIAPTVAGSGSPAPASADVAPTEEPAAPTEDFALKGRLKHAAADDGWVDVMGVVVNSSGAGYGVASFDLSLYDGAGELICVDTISVNQLKAGQERAFRSAIRCPDYAADQVASWKLQFAGGH